MCGFEIDEIVFASRSKRARSSALSARLGGRTLTATVRSSRVSLALYTSPMPPAPQRLQQVGSRSACPWAMALKWPYLATTC